jgi:holin-like protein
LIPLPVPAAIYGFILLFMALCTGLLKQEQIRDTADFLISGMGILFVAPAVNILAYYDLIAPQLAKICLIVVLSTVVVFAVSGWVTQWLRKKGDSNG